MKRTTILLCVLLLILCAVFAAVSAGAADLKDAEAKAQSLKSLGLFRGVSDTDFDLNREPTRVEALVMLIRTLGKESEAQNGSWSHPFVDVPSWADPYVGYAYQNGLTKGVSAAEFGTGNASAAMYVTFMLRALGYSESDGDFTWDSPFDLAKKCGILPDGVDLNRFLRADVAEISYSALSAKLKGSADTLSDRLVSAGVFTSDKLKSALSAVVGQDSGTSPRSKLPEIFILPVQPREPSLPASADGPAIDD